MTHESYERHRDQAAGRQAEQSRQGREIGPLPDVQDKKLRERCDKSFHTFLDTCFPEAFPLPWSDQHRDFITKGQRVVEKSQSVAAAYMRGFGKSGLFERLTLWSELTGRVRYAFIVASTAEKADENLDAIRREVETNDHLLALYPEVCYPIRCLEGLANRANGQLLDGRRTQIVWKGDKLVLPTVEGSPSSGCVIAAAGLMSGNLRGAKHPGPNGEIWRPQLVLADDCQTRESARSPDQSENRHRILTTDIKGMAGPNNPLSILCAVTIIREGDMAARLTDRRQSPQFRGERHGFLEAWPERMDLWNEYHERLTAEWMNDGDGSQATEFYKQNRAEMDRGARVSWPERVQEPHQISGVQYALETFLVDPVFFWSELQNQPGEAEPADEDLLDPTEIAKKQHNQKRGVVPLAASKVVGFIDCHEKLLYWMVAAFAEDFSGFVLDYGTFPDQKRSYFTMRDARVSLKHKFKKRKNEKIGEESALKQGLETLCAELLSRSWRREDGTELQIERLLVDEGWKPEVVRTFIREARTPALLPAKGYAVKATDRSFADYTKKAGERVGQYWRIRTDPRAKVRFVITDVNHWKSFVHSRLATSIGDRGSLSLYKAKPSVHRMLADHFRAEERSRVEAKGRVVDQWDPPPNKPDNHLFDCAVGCCAAASIEGIQLAEVSPDKTSRQKPRSRKKVSYL